MSDNIFKELREDHNLQRELIESLTSTSGDTNTRKELFRKLKNELEDHAKAEERHFYSPLMSHELTIEMARHSVAEHKELDDIIEDLDKTEFDSSAWLKKAKHLEHRLIHHLKEEEREVFPLAGKALNELDKARLASKYNKEMESYRVQ